MMWQTQTTIEYPFALRPASIEEAGLFYSQMDEAEDAVLGTVGHIRMDFGASGKEFYHTWWPHNGDQFNTGEFKDELQKFVDMLRADGPLTNLASMRNYCYQHGGKITEDGRCFGYIAETEHYRYCLRCTPSPGEYQGYGIAGRTRLFEVVQKVAEVNARRRQAAPSQQLTGSSWNDPEVQHDPSLALDYIVAPPRMAHYIDWSTKIYGVYLKYLALEDIFPYSIDEVFMDVTNYLDTYKMTARELARTIILDILKTTGITAAAGIGTNLYLAKIAMDIVAKHVQPDKDGVRIAKLNEMTYRKLLWTHRPLTDFWRVGRGYATKLETNGLYTMGDIARCSIGKPTDYHNEELLYRLFGVNAELLIDHAWGWEPCTIADVKAYKPENKSIVSGQVLQCPYPFDKARLVVREMADSLALDLVDKGLVTNQLVLTVGYDIENLAPTRGGAAYAGETTTDRYGRKIPKHAVGTENFSYTSSANDLLETITALYDRIVDKALLVRRLSISANRLLHEEKVPKQDEVEQLDLFTDYAAKEKQKAENAAEHARERKIQETILGIKKKFGKNAILKGLNLEDGATARERNQTIGGHQA